MPATEVLQVDARNPNASAIVRAAAVLRAGGLVAFPTETVYGLGANALDAAAVVRIFEAKGRPANNPLIVHVAEAARARELVAEWPDAAALLARRFWPGPLTLVLPRGRAVPEIVAAGGPTVAVRMPAHPVARGLIEAAGLPIAAPSANRSSGVSPTRAEHVLRDLGGRIDLILDGGPTPGGLESTVLDLTTVPPRLLRPGLVTPGEIEAIIGPIRVSSEKTTESRMPMPSPGMLARHYAPRALLECAADDGWERVEALLRSGVSVGWLTFDLAPDQVRPGLFTTVMPRDAVAYASQLYAVLHRLDDAGAERIVVILPPDTEEWLAVRDRLGRAAAP
jgi:L-threonylcarbamoyladenylate synthase